MAPAPVPIVSIVSTKFNDLTPAHHVDNPSVLTTVQQLNTKLVASNSPFKLVPFDTFTTGRHGGNSAVMIKFLDFSRHFI